MLTTHNTLSIQIQIFPYISNKCHLNLLQQILLSASKKPKFSAMTLPLLSIFQHKSVVLPPRKRSQDKCSILHVLIQFFLHHSHLAFYYIPLLLHYILFTPDPLTPQMLHLYQSHTTLQLCSPPIRPLLRPILSIADSG